MLSALVLRVRAAGRAARRTADAIDDFVNQELVRQTVPGVAVGIMHHGELVRAAGYGYANIEHHVPVHPDTVFQSGSIGKQFTAAAVMLLVEDGKVKLDESIRSYLPKAPKPWQPITVRHMLTHTSGIAGDPGMELRKDYSDDELLDLDLQSEAGVPSGPALELQQHRLRAARPDDPAGQWRKTTAMSWPSAFSVRCT